MQNTRDFIIPESVNFVGETSVRIFKNYFRKILGYQNDFREITLAYSNFRNKMLVSLINNEKKRSSHYF